MLDFIEGEIQAGQVGEVSESADMRNEVVIQVEFFDSRSEAGEAFDLGDGILAEA